MTKTLTLSVLSRVESYLYIVLFLSISTALQAQGSIQVTVIDGDAETTCGGFLGFDPIVQWSVNVESEGAVIYPEVFNCFTDFPNIQYTSDSDDCYWNAPSSIEVCFRAFENEGIFCNVNEDCSESICGEFLVPINSGEVIEYTLRLPDNLESSGFVTFEIEIIGDYIGNSNDDPCTALNMGIINSNSVLGSDTLSQFNNSCANFGGLNADPAPGYPNITDNQGLWFQFETGDEFIDLLSIKAISDPENLGDPVNLQMVLYEMQDGNCSVLQFLNAEDDLDANNIALYQNCVPANTTFAFLVDGTFDSGAGVEGFFDVQITAETVQQAPNFVCDAENLGVVPDGGNVNSTLWTNNCADAVGDPTPNEFSLNQSVWFQFTAPPSGHVIINTTNHLPLIGNEMIDLQIALFETNDNSCSGFLTEISSSYDNNNLDQTLDIQCLEADQPYWILVDGATNNVSAAFDISVEDGGIFPPVVDSEVTICNGSSYEIGLNSYDNEGLYIDTLVATNGCDSIVNTNLFIADSIQIAVDFNTIASGYTIQDAEAVISIAGGSGSYSINWQDGTNQNTISNLEGGANVCVTVTDELSCTNELCTLVPYSGENLATIVPFDVLCNGGNSGSLELNAGLGLAPFTYDWETLDGLNMGSGTFEDQISINNLSADIYSITVTDQNNVSTILITSINEPDPIEQSSFTINHPSCIDFCDGSLDIQVTGGTGEYTYDWINSDLVGNTVFELCAQTYDLIVRDKNGCEGLFSLVIENPAPLNISIEGVNPVSCFDGNDGQALVTSNVVLENILWDNGETTALATQLNAGVHSVTISDINGCSTQTTTEISQPDTPLDVILNIESNISCNGFDDGAIGSTIVGTGISFSYDWSLLNSINSFSSTTAIAENLNAGAYQLLVTNELGCTAVESIELVEPSPLEFSVESTDATCLNDGNSGVITVQNPIGGTSPYLYALDNETFSNSNIFENVPIGMYTITVQDIEGCETENMIEVAPPPPVVVTPPDDMEINLGESIEVSAFSPNPSVGLIWSLNGNFLECDNNCENITLSPAVSTIYQLTATDSISSCTETFDFLIEVDAQRRIYFPNAFTPNNDGINDYFIPYGGVGVEKVSSLMIFDRSGNQVFQLENVGLEDQTVGWQGSFRNQEVAQGVYVYIANIEFKDGVIIQYKGDVTLIR